MRAIHHLFRGRKPASADDANHLPAEKLADSIQKPWLQLRLHSQEQLKIRKPHELESEMKNPPSPPKSLKILDQIHGSLIGLAVGDALGAPVEFRPRQFLLENRVTDFQKGGTWDLKEGQFTDDTSMALCLASSLVSRGGFCPYDQLVRYKWWYQYGYLSSIGECFDIGTATRESIEQFQKRQENFAKKHHIKLADMDYTSDKRILAEFDVNCSQDNVAGNGALMRLAPVPLFFFQKPDLAISYSGISGKITHGDRKAIDACRYYGALIAAALHGETREQILDVNFYSKHKAWFGKETLCKSIKDIAEGSYRKKNGYEGGIRGKGYVVFTLEAALWALNNDEGSFEKGVLDVISLGDDTDTTAAIYGQLAGALYGYSKLPEKWTKQVYAKDFIGNLALWIDYESSIWNSSKEIYQIQCAERLPMVNSSTFMKPRDTVCLRATLSDASASSYHERYPRTSMESQIGRSMTDLMTDKFNSSQPSTSTTIGANPIEINPVISTTVFHLQRPSTTFEDTRESQQDRTLYRFIPSKTACPVLLSYSHLSDDNQVSYGEL